MWVEATSKPMYLYFYADESPNVVVHKKNDSPIEAKPVKKEEPKPAIKLPPKPQGLNYKLPPKPVNFGQEA